MLTNLDNQKSATYVALFCDATGLCGSEIGASISIDILAVVRFKSTDEGTDGGTDVLVTDTKKKCSPRVTNSRIYPASYAKASSRSRFPATTRVPDQSNGM